MSPARPNDPATPDPTPCDPAPPETTSSEPTSSEPTPASPAPADAAPSDPAPSDPAPSDPAPVSPTPADPNPPALSHPSPTRVLLIGAAAGTGAAVLLPPDRPGLGWLLTALLVFALLRRVRPGWAVLSVALFATGAFTASSWLFALCAIAGCAAGSLAVAGGRTPWGLFVGSVAVPVAALRSVPWLGRGLRAGGAPAFLRPALVTAGLLLVFTPLLASADQAFADLLASALPEAPPQSVALFFAVGLGAIGSCCLIAVPLTADDDPNAPGGPASPVARRDWALPVGALVLLFAAFVGVQVSTLFGGDDHVLATTGLTYAQHARSGFWQLLLVTALTLGVIATAARRAGRDEPGDRRLLRLLLGALAVLTLVIVASALTRMWVYQQAYGFTVLRVLVSACELWLGVVYLLVLAAGVELDGRWLPRAVLGTGLAALLAIAALNPDRFTAERNVDRWRATGDIDVTYLSRLSDDAVPVLVTLPSELRACALQGRRVEQDDWRTWNLGRRQAWEALRGVSPRDVPIRPCGRW
ncbi:DUF4173 domain-containing protein [Saccharothrix xinjiangensis]|uniref:DUF4173 domain-containing protein n=1 Tax=Saccharothrix xinjiangensis TaxID=204798 RepID=A0ABV9YEL2_9PSEU